MPDEKTGPYQVTPSSNNNVLKIALIVFGILLLVLLAEGGYYVYNNYFKAPEETSQERGPDLGEPLVVDDEPISVKAPTPSGNFNLAVGQELF